MHRLDILSKNTDHLFPDVFAELQPVEGSNFRSGDIVEVFVARQVLGKAEVVGSEILRVSDIKDHVSHICCGKPGAWFLRMLKVSGKK